MGNHKPRIKLNITTDYYKIEGLTEDELRKQINTLGPTDNQGRHAAYTKWEIICSKQQSGLPLVELKIAFTFPKWDKPNNPNLNIRWTRYTKSLIVHEDGHKDIAIKASKEINETLYTLYVSGDFVGYNNVETGIVKKLETKYRLLEIKYDSSTNHGRTQGAVFP